MPRRSRPLTAWLPQVACALGLGVIALSVQARDVLQAFGLAVRANDLTFVARMPELGLDERTRDDLRNNLLMIAIRDEGEAMALRLLDLPKWQTTAVLNYENQLGETALMVAAMKGSLTVAQRLIELGAEVNRAGWSALHYAATAGHTGLIRLLLEKSAYVDAASPNGTTPLMMAARFNHRDAAAALLELGADPTQTSQSGMTARDYAQENKNQDLAFWLELQEISFLNKYLSNVPQVAPDATLKEVVIQSGGEVVTVQPSSAVGTGQGGPALPPAVQPSTGVEVQGVQ